MEQQQSNETGAENGHEASGSRAHEIQNIQEQKRKAREARFAADATG